MLIVGQFTKKEAEEIKKMDCKVLRKPSVLEVNRFIDSDVTQSISSNKINLIIDIPFDTLNVLKIWQREKDSRENLKRNQNLDRERLMAADLAFEEYDFQDNGDIPEESDIEDHEGWDCDGNGMFTKLFYYTNPDGESSLRGTFRVLFGKNSSKITGMEVST